MTSSVAVRRARRLMVIPLLASLCVALCAANGPEVVAATAAKKQPSTRDSHLPPALSPWYVKHADWQTTVVALRATFAKAADLNTDKVAVWGQLERAFPLECDWFVQDLTGCGLVCSADERNLAAYPLRWFTAQADPQIERKLILRVVDELGAAAGDLRAAVDRLEKTAPPHDRAWLDLYVDACRRRRVRRLEPLASKCPSFVFTKHYNMGGSHYAYTEGLSDAQAERHFTPGTALCLLEMDGATPQIRTLLNDPQGVIRDPDVSYDGRRVLFAWKKSLLLDDYHLYEMDLASGSIRQLTYGLGFADYEGAYLPDGDIVFNSTRCVQTVDCFTTEVSNLYACDRNGDQLRRLGFDQVHTNFPTVRADGRVLYTRWEYNDRGQIYPQALFQMNADGGNQTAFYGNNSYFPTTILHARNIVGTQKVLAIATGHHSRQTGKLIVLDPSRGREEAAGAQLVAPVRETKAERIDAYGQTGELFQYPYPLSESEYLVTYNAWGWQRRPLLFGVYFMTSDGRRELLAADPQISCNQPIPLVRPAPRMRPHQVDYTRSDGTFYVQNVYVGPGLAGIGRGAAKRLRVVALDYRPALLGGNYNRGVAGEAFIATPIAVGNGCWDVKVILGETPIHADGSAFFRVPARTPVYFQVLDDRGHAIQSMRSWSTLQPGENLACVGCHEDKNSAPTTFHRTTLALAAGPQPLESIPGPPRGFSFPQRIQPILDRHCVGCHFQRERVPALGRGLPPAARPPIYPGQVEPAFSLLAEETVEPIAKRRWSDAYLALTAALPAKRGDLEGVSRPLVNWTSPQSAPPMLPPYSAGAATSGLLPLLEQGHKGVRLARDELATIACWIDLVIPYCGDYREANAWTPEEHARYDRMLAKRRCMEAAEARGVRDFLLARQNILSAGAEKATPRNVPLRLEAIGADGHAFALRADMVAAGEPLTLTLPRPFEPGDHVRVTGAEHLALGFDTAQDADLLFAKDRHIDLPVPPPKSHDKMPSQVRVRPLALRDLDAYRNLAANRIDVQGSSNVFPQATAGDSRVVSAACQAIDGFGERRRSDDSFRAPAAPDQQKARWRQVDFGREVELDKIVITLRADSPRGPYWRQAALVFSDETRQPIQLEPSTLPQAFIFRPRRTAFVRLAEFVPQESLGRCVLDEFEAWGRDPVPIATDLAATASIRP